MKRAAALACLVGLSVLGPVGACGGPVQVDGTVDAGPDGTSESGSSGGPEAGGSEAGGPEVGGPEAGSPEAGSTGRCIVDVDCPPPASNRVEVFLSGDPAANPDAAGWKFHQGDVAGAQTSTFDDSSWSAVALPYSWNALDGQQGPIQTPAYYTGIGWYRRHYTIPTSMTGKRIYLQLDESAFTTNAWVNGAQVGTHAGGYTRFRFDITSAAKVGADNVIAVQVDNSQAVSPTNAWLGGTNGNVAPLSGDFTLFGGIERDVRVLATDDLAVTPLDFGGPGVYLKATEVSAASATFTATVRLLNAGAVDKTASVEVDVLDETNAVFQTLTATQLVPAGKTVDAVLSQQVAHPHLWDGQLDPYVYHVDVVVKDGATVTDAIVQPFGFRAFALDPNKGFALNGKSLPLHGVAMHQDHHGLAGQFSFKDARYLAGVDEDHALLHEIGATFVRHVHYPHSDYAYSLDDYEGLVAWAEDGFVNRVPATCDTAAHCAPFIADTQQQLTELIRQNYNHPSIAFWSIGNEVLLKQGPDPLPVMQNLATVAKAEDPTRTVVYAANAGTDANAVDWTAQATFFNEYFGWYGGKVADLGPWADAVHAAHPTTALGLSEYGAGSNPSQHGLPIVETGNDRTGATETEEYQAFFHEQYWAQIATRPFLTVTSVWNMFDFASDYRSEAGEPGLNTKGLITFDRSIKKDAFYFYKASWAKEPVVYIASRRYANLPQTSSTIKVYSNQAVLALTLNGSALPTPKPANGVFQWTGVAWASGSNVVSVTASGCTATGALACTDQVTWTK